MSLFQLRAAAHRQAQAPSAGGSRGAVVVVLDDSPATEDAVDWAAAEADARGAALQIVAPVPWPSVFVDPWDDEVYPADDGQEAYADTVRQLRVAARRAREVAPHVAITAITLPGTAALRDLGPDSLLVVARHATARGLRARAAFWPAARRTGHPVAAVQLRDTRAAAAGTSTGRVIVGLDLAAPASAALDAAFGAAARRGAGLTVLHAAGRQPSAPVMDDLLAPYRAAFPDVRVDHYAVTSVVDALVAESWGASLAVVGTQGFRNPAARRRERRLLQTVRGTLVVVPPVRQARHEVAV